MPQYGRPSADTTRVNWEDQNGEIVDIYRGIDEVNANDADFVRTSLVPVSAVYVTKLSSLVDPMASNGHTVRYRYGKDQAGGAQINLTVELRQGYTNEGAPGTLIASTTHSNVAAFPVDGSFALAGTEADSITDYSALSLRFVASQV